MPRTVTPITSLPDNVTTALLKAANSQAVDIAASGDVDDAQVALTAAQVAVTDAQNAEVKAHSQATADTNAGIQSIQTWIQSLAVPVATEVKTPPITTVVTDPPVTDTTVVAPPAADPASPPATDPNDQPANPFATT